MPSRKQSIRYLKTIVQEQANFYHQHWRDMGYPYAVELQLQTKSRKPVLFSQEIWSIIKGYLYGVEMNVSLCVFRVEKCLLKKQNSTNEIKTNKELTITSAMNFEQLNSEIITGIKEKGMSWVNNILERDLTYTKPGSISHLLYGEKPSEQSINIKLGRLGEFLSKELIKTNSRLELLNCGIQKINDKKKDVDLIFKDEMNKIIYYRELKGNIELDTEKLPATINKCQEIVSSLEQTYVDYTINCGILNWSVYNRQILTAGISNIRTFETGGIKIDHMEDFLKIINIVWNEDDYYSYFREIGTKIKTKFE